MDDLARALSQIEASLQGLERDVLAGALRPGLPGEAVRSALGSVGLAVNYWATEHARLSLTWSSYYLPASGDEMEQLYDWHGGTSTAGIAAVDDIHLFPGFYLLSIEDAIANYRAFVTDERWTPGWLPIFANGGGDFYVADLGSAAGSPVRHFRIDEVEHPIEFPSLGAMVSTLAQAFEREIFFVDQHGYLDMDDLIFGSLAAKLNPDVAWWADS